MTKPKLHFIALNVVITVLISVSLGFYFANRTLNTIQNDEITTTKTVLVESSSLIEAIDKLTPAVVSIVASKELALVQSPFGLFDFFSGLERQQAPQTNGKQKVGGGTGFIIKEDGLVLTNKHVVVDSGAEYTVILSDGTQMFAEVLSLDPVSDLAVVQLFTDEQRSVKPSDLPTSELGDSSSLRVGSRVIAIGNALSEFSNTTTFGIISGLGRSIQASDGRGRSSQLSDLLQTDASINPGNSGGPLANLDGQVIGINTAVAQSADGIGFAIPINEAKVVVDSVLKHGKIIRPALGVRYIEITPKLAKTMNLAVEQGAWLADDVMRRIPAVIPDSPAFKAGLKANDIILKVDGAEIDTAHSLSALIQKYTVGESIKLTVLRNEQKFDFVVELSELDFNN